jgi:hypothetical protein
MERQAMGYACIGIGHELAVQVMFSLTNKWMRQFSMNTKVPRFYDHFDVCWWRVICRILIVDITAKILHMSKCSMSHLLIAEIIGVDLLCSSIITVAGQIVPFGSHPRTEITPRPRISVSNSSGLTKK